MLRTMTIGGVAVAALLLSTAAQAQQKMPGKKACQRGMSHSECVSRCVALGGVGRHAVNPKCAHRCTKKGCV
jgi:hypothetical protein